MAKKYGLIIPGLQEKNVPTTSSRRETILPFNSDDSDSDSNFMKKTKPIHQTSITERRMAKKLQEKALAEDSSVFQYDEIYDDIKQQRNAEVKAKTNESKKSKYVERLLLVAERRKLENELRIERQVQKERELEGEEFKEKEKFVTEAYKKKLEEMRKLVESNSHEEYLESIGDVTKQKDLGGFYRHLYEQKLGTPENKQKISEISYKPLKQEKEQNHRNYRKRIHIEEKEREQENTKHIGHLENNFDADSDFSIDSSTSEEDECVDKKKQADVSIKSEQKDNVAIAINIPSLNKKEVKEHNLIEDKKDVSTESKESSIIKPIKVDKKKIWEKRTVGPAFESALQRYFERKSHLVRNV